MIFFDFILLKKEKGKWGDEGWGEGQTVVGGIEGGHIFEDEDGLLNKW